VHNKIYLNILYVNMKGYESFRKTI